MKMTCPHCGVIGSAHDSQPGEKVRCPQCDKVFKVMDQEITCPHCAVAGSAAGSAVGAKLRCPRCEKVFLLTMDRFAASSVPAEGGMAVSVAEEKGEFVIPEPEMGLEAEADETIVIESASLPELEQVEQVEMIELAGVDLEPETALQQLSPEPEAEDVPPFVPVPVSEIAVEMEPMVEAVAELPVEVEMEVESVPQPELKLELEPEPVLESESVPEMEAEESVEPVMEMEPEAEKFPETPPEMVSEIISEPEPGVVSALESEQEPEPVAEMEAEESFEPVMEVEPEVEKLPEAPPEMVSVIIPEPEPEVVSVLEPELAPEPESVSPVVKEEVAVEMKEEIPGVEEPEWEVMPFQICAGCGESFHPQLLQEVDGKLFCGVCQLRMAATIEEPPKAAGGRLRGVFAALILLGLLALIALLLMKFGII